MPYYSVIEGEGVAGPTNAVSATTTALYSCMGIVFHNHLTNMAGLYHYGSQSLHDLLTQNTIIQMINDLNPIDIYVTAPPAGPMGIGASLADVNNVDLFLIQHALGIHQWMPSQVWPNYWVGNGAFNVNVVRNVGTTRRSIEMATQVPNPVGRTFGGNTTFYGGNGPNAPTHGSTTDDTGLLGSRRTTGRNVFG